MKKIAFTSLLTGGVIGIITNIILSGNVIPNSSNTDEWFRIITSSWFLVVYVLYILLAYLFPLIGFAYISNLFKTNKLSVYALVFSILGTVTVLPTMRFIAYSSTIYFRVKYGVYD